MEINLHNPATLSHKENDSYQHNSPSSSYVCHRFLDHCSRRRLDSRMEILLARSFLQKVRPIHPLSNFSRKVERKTVNCIKPWNLQKDIHYAQNGPYKRYTIGVCSQQQTRSWRGFHLLARYKISKGFSRLEHTRCRRQSELIA